MNKEFGSGWEVVVDNVVQEWDINTAKKSYRATGYKSDDGRIHRLRAGGLIVFHIAQR